LIRASINLRKEILAKQMDCRVKPGNDDQGYVFFPFTAASKLAFAEPGRSASSTARRAQTQNRENNPMQSRIRPARSTRAACVQGTRRKMIRRRGPT